MTTEVQTEAKVKKPVEKTEVTMSDGRKVEFAGKRKLMKEVLIDRETGTASVRFDFRNGETRLFNISSALTLDFAGHGASQKIGDEAAVEEDVEDMVIAIDNVIARLNEGKWSAERASGDGFSGASVVVKAIAEVSGKTIDEVKAFLEAKLKAAADKGEKLSRQELYKSFRNPNSKTGQVILRLEQEKASKTTGPSADDLLNELG